MRSVKAVLGKPSVVVGNEMVYSSEIEKKTSPKDLDGLRRQHPEMSEAELRPELRVLLA